MLKRTSLLLVIFSLAIFSCSKDKDPVNAEDAYTRAMKLLKDTRYSDAAEKFEKIDDDFPLSKWGSKGQVMAAYCYYKEKKYDDVIKVSEDFVRLNPNHEDMPYILYLKGISYYNRIPDITRAQNDTQSASYTFRELVARFPETDWAIDAEEKLTLVDEHLAGFHMSIGRYSMLNRNYVGAIGNFTEVINRYSRTNQMPEAYLRLSEIYFRLGIKEEAFKSVKLLEDSYPDSEWEVQAQKILNK